MDAKSVCNLHICLVYLQAMLSHLEEEVPTPTVTHIRPHHSSAATARDMPLPLGPFYPQTPPSSPSSSCAQPPVGSFNMYPHVLVSNLQTVRRFPAGGGQQSRWRVACVHGVPTPPQVGGDSMSPKPSGVAGLDEVFGVLGSVAGGLGVEWLGWNLPAGWLGQR